MMHVLQRFSEQLWDQDISGNMLEKSWRDEVLVKRIHSVKMR